MVVSLVCEPSGAVWAGSVNAETHAGIHGNAFAVFGDNFFGLYVEMLPDFIGNSFP